MRTASWSPYNRIALSTHSIYFMLAAFHKFLLHLSFPVVVGVHLRTVRYFIHVEISWLYIFEAESIV